jgi:hypothetical protein
VQKGQIGADDAINGLAGVLPWPSITSLAEQTSSGLSQFLYCMARFSIQTDAPGIEVRNNFLAHARIPEFPDMIGNVL